MRAPGSRSGMRGSASSSRSCPRRAPAAIFHGARHAVPVLVYRDVSMLVPIASLCLVDKRRQPLCTGHVGDVVMGKCLRGSAARGRPSQ